MKERNIYKTIVIIAAVFFAVVFARGRIKLWLREQKSYGFIIRSQSELTEGIVGEFVNLRGLMQFLPSAFASVTLKLEEYTLEAELVGIYPEEYPLKWEAVKETASLSNTAALFLGKECFAAFTDQNGYGPTKSQIERWIAHYEDLSIVVLDQTGQEKKAKVFGILAEPEGLACMDKKQMEEVFGGVCQVRGGYMQIHGYRNGKTAKRVLEDAGFSVEEVSLN